MAGLESLTGDDPAGAESPTQGDNRIRELTQKAKESMSKEHTLSGIHAIMSGTATARPAAGNKGRFYVLIETGVEKELQYDNGSSWESITKNEDVVGQIADFVAHTSSNPIDHAASSVLHTHLISGILKKKHFDSTQSSNNESVSGLIDGSELDSSWHTHPVENATADGRPTFLSSKWTVASGTSESGTATITKTKTLDSGDIPDGAVAVILEAYGKCFIDDYSQDFIRSPGIRIKGRLSNGDETDWLLLIGGFFAYHDYTQQGLYATGWKGQGTFPITTTGNAARKIDYEVVGLNFAGSSSGWEIRLIGYI